MNQRDTQPDTANGTPHHLRITKPLPWVARFAPLVPAAGTVLDLACGGGRHAGLFLDRGHGVLAIDRDTRAVADLARVRFNPGRILRQRRSSRIRWA